jgi:hypothetical protein
MIQLFSERAPPLQKIAQTLMADAFTPSVRPVGMKLHLPPEWQADIEAIKAPA